MLPSLRPATLLAAALLLASCEKGAPFVERVKEALDRQPEAATAAAEAEIPPPPEPVKMEPVVNKDARVSVLGYHDFTEGTSTNDMILNIEDFRKQMEAIRDAKLPVISMRQFLDWKQGKGAIPPESILITIDDGWRATHTLALGVLKEFGYPFTVFLYKNYINIGGRSLTHEEVREIAAHGGTISSHSVSHQNLSKRGGRSDAAYDAWLRQELVDSMAYLEETYGDTGAVERTFAYPFGIYNDRVVALAQEAGYEACFTVNGKKTGWDAPDMEIGRYVVHGKTLANFEPALDFGGGSAMPAGRKFLTEGKSEAGEARGPLVAVRPEANAVVGNRLPLVEIDLSKLEGVDPKSLVLRISGFGRVTHQFDPASGRVSYQIPQRLRSEGCSVQLSFRHAGSKDSETVAWSFRIDPLADYLSSDATAPGRNEALRTAPDEDAPPTATPAP
jgi:peptidoglycan/xylan/chitin deacetylase (PgdA/CDA1 family)